MTMASGLKGQTGATKKKAADEEAGEAEDRVESAIKERIEENVEPETAGSKLIKRVKKAQGHLGPAKRGPS